MLEAKGLHIAFRRYKKKVKQSTMRISKTVIHEGRTDTWFQFYFDKPLGEDTIWVHENFRITRLPTKGIYIFICHAVILICFKGS